MIKATKTLAMTLVAAFALTACGGGGLTGPASPEDIAMLRNELISQAIQLADDSENAAELAPKIAELKENYIQQYVALGASRAVMSDEEKAEFDKAAEDAMINNFDAEKFAVFNDMAQDIRSEDNDLANEIVALNTLSQYAFYELLKEQMPEEATRLGIE